MTGLARRIATPCAASIFLGSAAAGAEIKVMVSGGFTAAYLDAVPKFEKHTGHKIATTFGASMGNAPDSIPIRLQRGEPVDVVILGPLSAVAASTLSDPPSAWLCEPGRRSPKSGPWRRSNARSWARGRSPIRLAPAECPFRPNCFPGSGSPNRSPAIGGRSRARRCRDRLPADQ